MKHGWVTDSVKRAADNYHWATTDYPKDWRFSNAIEDFEEYLGLQEALDLLHFAAERADAHTKVEVWERGHWIRTYDSEPLYLSFDQYNSESLLHAVLLAIDSIVTHKPEAFE